MSQLSMGSEPLPIGWQLNTLGQVCDVLDNQRKPITKKDRVSGEYPYYGATGILDYVDDFIFDEKLVLIGEDGAKWGVGENTAFAATGKYWVNNHAHVIRPHRDVVLDEWIIYYLNTNDLSPFITGLTVPKLNQGKLKEIPLPLPPLPEQKRIVAILAEAFTGINQAVTNAEKNLDSASELFESYLNNVFVQNGKGWQVKRLDEVSRVVNGGTPKTKVEEYWEGPHCWITPAEMGNRNNPYVSETKRTLTDAGLRKSSAQLVSPLSVILSTRAPIGHLAINTVPMATNQGCKSLVPSETLDYKFLFYFLLNSVNMLNDLGAGATFKELSAERLKGVKFSLPQLSEQKLLVEQMDSLRTNSQHLETIYQQKLTALNELKQSILQKAFAGELTSDKAHQQVVSA